MNYEKQIPVYVFLHLNRVWSRNAYVEFIPMGLKINPQIHNTHEQQN